MSTNTDTTLSLCHSVSKMASATQEFCWKAAVACPDLLRSSVTAAWV